jgi:hypothetical protein
MQTCNVSNAAVMRIGSLAQSGVYNVLRCHLKAFYQCPRPVLPTWLMGRQP